ncbi:uncharacterized protein LOC144101074 [Amblyomma americanum]
MPSPMRRGSLQTVFGFGGGIDWRPTCFVNPFPSNRVCSVCGLVPPTAAMLPCRHLLCQPCYDRSGAKRDHCPLDEEPFQEEDVLRSTFSRDTILGRKVHCWNVENGCDAEDSASAMLEHFANVCQFHVVSCPRCNEKVPHRDIARHQESACAPSCTREQQRGDNFANAFLEVKEALRKISQENASLHAKLDAFQEGLDINSVMAALSSTVASVATAAVEKTSAECRVHIEASIAEQLGQFSSCNVNVMAESEAPSGQVVSDECNQNVEGLKGEVLESLNDECVLTPVLHEPTPTQPTAPLLDEAEALELLANVSFSIHSDVFNVSTPYEWTIDDWKAFCLKSDHSMDYFTGNDGDARYHYGYLMIPRLCCSPLSNVVWLRLYFIKGLFDRFLQWPMQKATSLHFVHPSGCRPSATLSGPLKMMRGGRQPLGVNKDVVCAGYLIEMPIRTLQEGGFIADNKLRLRLEFAA